MPQIHFFNVDKEVVEKFYSENIDNFYNIASASKTATHVVCNHATYINEPDYAYVRIEWMSRSEEVQENVKALIQGFLIENGYPQSAIHFIIINPKNYYAI